MASKIQSLKESNYKKLLSDAKTNTTLNSTRAVVVKCPDLWSITQEFCLTRARYNSTTENSMNSTSYSDHTKTYPSKRQAYINRAKRIAATYARFYLETEEHGTKTKEFKGRYLWMALGAFASKEVSFALSGIRAQLGDGIKMTSTIDWLGKGNFWLFQDIAGWHYYNNRFKYPNFAGCEPLRNWNTLQYETKKKVNNGLVWANESLPKIKYLQTNDFIKVAFAAADSFTKARKNIDKQKYQRANLVTLADHEQRMILQPLIYNTQEAKDDITSQRTFSAFAPGLKLTLSAKDSGDYESEAHTGIKLENVEDRMKWIYNIANDFEDMMKNNDKKTYIETELGTIAGWL